MSKILLVEDDPFLVDIYSSKFKENGFEIDSATGGEEALQKLGENKYDLVILDIVLPQIDGWEILSKIKKDLKLDELKVVILSNLSQKEEVEKGIELGASRYLIKAHYTPSQVVDEIKKILNE